MYVGTQSSQVTQSKSGTHDKIVNICANTVKACRKEIFHDNVDRK